jgi:uncharacterized membrane protein
MEIPSGADAVLGVLAIAILVGGLLMLLNGVKSLGDK